MAKFEVLASAESAPKNPFKKLTESKLARAGAVAIGLHAAALSPQALEAARHGREAMSAFERSWFQENTVLHPQSEGEQKAIREVIKQRESRIDKKAVDSYKEEAARKIERGETPSFKSLYFDLEHLHGVPKKDVEEAEKVADQRIKEFSEMVGDSLDEKKIKKIVKQMYGSPSDYEWGQASVSEYFRTGKRNCDSIDRGEQVVFEGVIAHLPKEQQQKFTLGEREVKQHVIATLTEDLGNGTKRLYLLEPNLEATNAAPEAGTADVSADFLKRSVVSKNISVVQTAGGKILPSPDIDVVTDQPIPRGFVTVGDLKGAEFVMQEARIEGLKPAHKEAPKEDAIELQLEEKEHDPEDAIRNELAEDLKNASSPYSFGLWDLHHPSVELIDSLEKTEHDSGDKLNGFGIDNIDDWSPEVVKRLLGSQVEQLELPNMSGLPQENILVEKIVAAAKEIKKQKGFKFGIKRVCMGSWFQGTSNHFSSDNFRALMEAFDGVSEVRIDDGDLTTDEFETLKQSHVKVIDLSGVRYYPGSFVGLPTMEAKVFDPEVSWKIYEKLHSLKKRVVVDLQNFALAMLEHKELLGYKNLVMDIQNGDSAGMASLLAGTALGGDPAFADVAERIDAELRRRAQDESAQGADSSPHP